MHTAPVRFAPSIDALRLLRQLARGTTIVSNRNCSISQERRWQHATVQESHDSGPDDRLEIAPLRRKPLLHNTDHNTSFVTLAQTKEYEIEAQDDRLFLHVTSPEGWATVLASEERLRGGSGVKITLQRIRSCNVDLPVHGATATQIWNTLAKYTDLHEELVQYAIELRERAGLVYWYLWRKVIAACLRGQRPDDARKLHDRMRRNGMILRGQLARLARGVPLTHASLTAFRHIYLTSAERDVYGALVSRLANTGLHDMAIAWHRLLLEHGDMPPKDMENHLFVKEMRRSDVCLPTVSRDPSYLSVQVAPRQHLLLRQDESQASVSTGISSSAGSRLTREIMSRILGDVHGVRPVDISDHVCARFFATTAFPVDFIVTGLAAFGVNEVGPLALRQLALRCNSTTDLLHKFDHIKHTGLSIHQSIFSAAVLKLAHEGKYALLQDMLSSDQHPDVISDKKTQLQLLQKHIKTEDWKSAHWTLYVLMHFHAESNYHAWNHLVRYHTRYSSWSTLAKVLEDILANSIRLTPMTIFQLLKTCLRPRRQGRRPVVLSNGTDDLLLLTNFLRALLATGQAPPTNAWTELARRFGMTGRWTELSHLLVYLAQQYSPNTSTVLSKGEAEMRTQTTLTGGRNAWQMRKAIERTYRPSEPQHPLRQLFPPTRQQAIIDWGFKTGFVELENFFRHQFRNDASRSGLETYSFRSTPHYQHLSSRITKRLPKPSKYPLRGLLLLKQLQECGVHIDIDSVRRAVENKLWMLYGPAGFSKVKANRRARMINPWTMEEMLAGVQEITGKPLRSSTTISPAVIVQTEATEPAGAQNESSTTAGHLGEILHLSRDGESRQKEQSLAVQKTTSTDELRLQRVLPETTSDALASIQLAEKTRKLMRSHAQVDVDDETLPDLSQRGELQRRVRLAVAFFGLGRYTHTGLQLGGYKQERMTLPMYVDLVKRWAHRRLKRKLGISGALARPKRAQPYVFGGRLRRAAVRNGTVRTTTRHG